LPESFTVISIASRNSPGRRFALAFARIGAFFFAAVSNKSAPATSAEQLELDLDVAGYFTLISLPLSHRASELALKHAARRGAMKRWEGRWATFEPQDCAPV
jgi:hypothetical protein